MCPLPASTCVSASDYVYYSGGTCGPEGICGFTQHVVQCPLEATLAELGATEIVVCGMMTHNCVTHTAISRSAEKYGVTILPDACTTVTELLHQIALHAVSTRVRLVPPGDALWRLDRRVSR